MSQVFMAALALLPRFLTAQYPLPPVYDEIIKSPINPNISISYKSPDPGTCTTTFTSQKQYTGYVNLPPFTLAPIQQAYSLNTFFWFIEARTNPETAPLTVWINGGPGSSSLIGLFQEIGPCQVVQVADGTFGTQPRLWGWDRSSNILFIDQPIQTGFSYDSLRNMTADLVHQRFSDPQYGYIYPTQPTGVTLDGTFSSQDSTKTANTTSIAAHAVWHFLQGFLAAFPQYNPGTRPESTAMSSTGINLFSESYGGIYGPAFAELFEEKNAQRATGDLPMNSTLEVSLLSLGIINGLIDHLIQLPQSLRFAANNTYGINAINIDAMSRALDRFNAPLGCKDAINICRFNASQSDPEGDGDETSVNQSCNEAINSCGYIDRLFQSTGRNVYDIREKLPSSFPGGEYREYLNTAEVQAAIGVPLNFTENSSAVQSAFFLTGDEMRAAQLPALSSLLSRGVRIALIYGDADYICNWNGGEAISLALASLLPSYAKNFRSAGYADILTNDSYVGGVVRQYGNLSFSRIYDSGHLVPAYQPETAFTVFTRIITGSDVSTGATIDLSVFKSDGPLNSTAVNQISSQTSGTCWVRDAQLSCTDEQLSSIQNKEGVVLNGAWYKRLEDFKPPSSTVLAGKPGSLPSSFSSSEGGGAGTSPPVDQTGVYVAPSKPNKNKAAALRYCASSKRSRVGVLLSCIILVIV